MVEMQGKHYQDRAIYVLLSLRTLNTKQWHFIHLVILLIPFQVTVIWVFLTLQYFSRSKSLAPTPACTVQPQTCPKLSGLTKNPKLPSPTRRYFLFPQTKAALLTYKKTSRSLNNSSLQIHLPEPSQTSPLSINSIRQHVPLVRNPHSSTMSLLMFKI